VKKKIARFMSRDVHPAVQFIKYALAGGAATAVDVAAFYAAAILLMPALTPGDPAARLLRLDLPVIAESVRSSNYVFDRGFAFFFSNLTAYVLNMLWVFTPGRHSRFVEFWLFFAVSGASFISGTALGWFLIHTLGLPTTHAYAANVATSVAINYVCRKYLVFKS
jgi:putative flippase GtrA